MADKTAFAALLPLERAFGALVKALTAFVAGERKPAYNPALHYMRGPGPKWRAKHALAQAKREG